MAKGEDSKAPASQPEGLKIKLSEGGHHGKEEPKSGVESGRAGRVKAAMWYRQEPDSRLWSYVYPSKYSEAPKPQEDDRWKEERDRKVKEERPRPKESLQKDEAAKEATEGRTQQPPEELRGGGKETRSYLPASYYASSYGGKVGAGEDSEKPSRSSPSVKPSSEAKALDLLQLHASQYKSKSPSIQDSKTPHDRERERKRERKGDRPHSSPSQRIMHSHHHLRYPLYDLSYPSAISHFSAAERSFFFPILLTVSLFISSVFFSVKVLE
ncbi:Ras-related protein Rab-33B [Sarotherodon galilaeus]